MSLRESAVFIAKLGTHLADSHAMILSTAAMKAIEEKAFAAGVLPEVLMEEAGALIAQAVRQFFQTPGVCLAVFGKGNNGGDALVAARHLAASGWDVRLVPAFNEKEWTPLVADKFSEAVGCRRDHAGALLRSTGRPLIVLDGLLGIGAKGELREPVAALTRAVNHLRQTADARVFAIDLPTGLDGDTGTPDPGCIVADTTLTIGFPKQGLIADAATAYVGRLCVLPLRELNSRLGGVSSVAALATSTELAPLLMRRGFDTHKGEYGKIGIVAGSTAYMGAAVLCATGALRAGAGLVTLYVPPEIISAIAPKLPPEIMLAPPQAILAALQKNHDVAVVGPGVGSGRSGELYNLVEKCTLPMVVDADAINAIATKPTILNTCAGERILTPHPGEMARLDPESAKRTRRDTVKAFTQRHPCTLLLKGARTIVGQTGMPFSMNTTGTPGMATGGNGDVLSGVIAALLGQRVRPYDAARLGAWLCGRASELAISLGGETEETLTPSRSIDFLGAAFRELRGRCF